MGSGRNRRFGVVPLFLPDIALSSVPSGADTALSACHRTIGRVSAASGGSGTSVRRFPHSILLLRRGWSGHNGCRAVALGSGGVSFVGSVHGTLGVGSYGVGGGLGGRNAKYPLRGVECRRPAKLAEARSAAKPLTQNGLCPF